MPEYRGQFVPFACASEQRMQAVPFPIVDIHTKPADCSTHRFDIEVEGHHCYLADGVVVHNSPEVTTGGQALKFYASVRLDIRRIETIRQGEETLGQRSRVKVVKNKVAPPFAQVEFDIMRSEGISRVGDLLDVGIKYEIIRKSGAWYYLGDDRLAQGRENVKAFLRDNPAVADEVERLIRERALTAPPIMISKGSRVSADEDEEVLLDNEDV